MDGIEGAGADAPAAALAFVRMDYRLARLIVDRVGSAFLRAFPAEPAQVRIHHGLSVIVLLHLSGPASAAHPDILDCAAEAGHLMPLEVGQ